MAQDVLLAELERIRPVLEEHVEQAEAERRLPDAVYDAMIDARLYRFQTPRAFGGLELHPVEAFRLIEAVARIDSAAAWNLNQSPAGGLIAAWLPKQGGEEIYDRGPDTLFAGGFFPPGPSVRVDGGWRVTARCGFASGCQRAHWFAVPVLEVSEDESRFDPDRENPPTIIAFVPRDEVDLLDTWHTSGMRGTFSADICVDDVFVPNHRVAFLDSKVRPSRAPAFSGPLYALWPWVGVLGQAVVALGIARAAIDTLVDLATRKTPSYSRIQLRDRERAQYNVAKATALIDASRAFLHETISDAYQQAELDGRYCSEESRMRCQLAACFATEACAQAVDLVHEVAGTTAIRIGHGIERNHRDTTVLARHAYMSTSRYEDVGKMIFGLPPDFFALLL